MKLTHKHLDLFKQVTKFDYYGMFHIEDNGLLSQEELSEIMVYYCSKYGEVGFLSDQMIMEAIGDILIDHYAKSLLEEPITATIDNLNKTHVIP